MLAASLGACSSGVAGGSFLATGAPIALPASGQLPVTSTEAFEGMLVGARGRPVVVNVWASWCGPCRVEAPLLQKAAQRYGDDVVFVGVNSHDDAAGARAFLRRFHITYPNIVDDDGAIARRLELRGFPTTYVFGRDGRLRSSVTGGISERSLAVRLKDALAS